MKQNFDCIVVGSGIAGMTAAIYLKRANKNVLLLEGYMPGGQINKTTNIENYPGFTKIDGPALVMNILNQVTSLEIPLKYEKVIEIDKEDDFAVKTSKDTYTTKSLILATGRTPNMLGLEDEEKFIGSGISYCALCDGSFFKDKTVIVVGGGNSAFQGALYLANICEKVTIVIRGSQARASMILQERVNDVSNIEVIYNEEIKKINSTANKIESVTLKNKELTCEGIFVYIGSTPNLNYVSKLNLEINNNYIVVDKNMKTSLNYVYACGDTIEKDVYQIVTAAGDGAIAATSLQKYIDRQLIMDAK